MGIVVWHKKCFGHKTKHKHLDAGMDWEKDEFVTFGIANTQLIKSVITQLQVKCKAPKG